MQEFIITGLIKPSNMPLYIVGIILCAVVPYLLGSLNFGLIISKIRYRDDVRTHGSGNAGMTNMLRTYGKSAAVLTLLGDILKAVVSALFGLLLMPGDGFAYIAGIACMLGHAFPIYFKFKGGKGVATSGIVIFMISPITGVICLACFILVVIGTRYVSLGSVMGLIFYPIVLNAFSHAYDPPRNSTACMIAVLMAVLVVLMHRENLKRIVNRTESKISFKKKTPPAEGGEA